MEKEKGTAGTIRSIPTGIATLAVIALGALVITACGDVDLSKKGGPAVADKAIPAAVADSACVSCHTDKEKLKMETAGIKAPPKSALTSGKG
jgi:mono/diheme cytochrome c family protein